jgi:hypothetical protein
VVLPSALDPALTRATLAATWDTIEAHVPRIDRNDTTTWTPVTEAETAAAAVLDRQVVGVGGYAPTSFGSLISIHNGTEEEVLDLFPRALYGVAEQLLEKDSVVWPAGCDEEGLTRGPLLMDDNAVYVRPAHAPHTTCLLSTVCLVRVASLLGLFLIAATAAEVAGCAVAGVGGLPPRRFPRWWRANTRRARQRDHN